MHDDLRRARAENTHGKVTFAELFFDLVFVFAVTQLSHTLAKHLDLLGLAQAAVLLLATWWIWVCTSWVTNWLDPETLAVRLMLFVLMLGGLLFSASIPDAFGARGLALALAYAAMQVGRSVFMVLALRGRDEGNARNFRRIAVWCAASGALWVAGGLAEGPARLALWAAGAGIDYAGPAFGFRVPGLGRSTTADWNVEGGHLAERCGLFVIIALGESVLVTGQTFGALPWTPATLAAMAASFVGVLALWSIYFNIGAERARRRIEHAADPGALARAAYTYVHLLIIAGIIVVAVGDEIVLAHPLEAAGGGAAAAIVLGPALYLLGNLVFKQATAGMVPLSHLAGIATLLVAWPFATGRPALGLAWLTVAVLVAVAAWEHLSLRHTVADADAPALKES